MELMTLAPVPAQLSQLFRWIHRVLVEPRWSDAVVRRGLPENIRLHNNHNRN